MESAYGINRNMLFHPIAASYWFRILIDRNNIISNRKSLCKAITWNSCLCSRLCRINTNRLNINWYLSRSIRTVAKRQTFGRSEQRCTRWFSAMYHFWPTTSQPCTRKSKTIGSPSRRTLWLVTIYAIWSRKCWRKTHPNALRYLKSRWVKFQRRSFWLDMYFRNIIPNLAIYCHGFPGHGSKLHTEI